MLNTIQNMSNRKGMPNKRQIVEYWWDKITEMYPEKGFQDFVEEVLCEDKEHNISFKSLQYAYPHIDKKNICFACGVDFITERCHILPINHGGTNDVENLHLLCKSCHQESEDLSGELYFEWLGTKEFANSGSFTFIMNKTKIVIDFLKKGEISKVFQMYPNLDKKVVEGWAAVAQSQK